MRQSATFPISETFADNLVRYAGRQECAAVFKGNGWQHGHRVMSMLGALHRHTGTATACADFHRQHADWMLVSLNYDIKNELESLETSGDDIIGFHSVNMVVPQWVVLCGEDHCSVHWIPGHGNEVEARRLVWRISKLDRFRGVMVKRADPVRCSMTAEDHARNVARLQRLIKLGYVYQANLCMEWRWNEAKIEAPELFNAGFETMPNPFSVYYKHRDCHALCYSPERFLLFEDREVTSQPMKGTAPRGETAEKDTKLRQQLASSEKDRRENVMIVDMVRNDLSHFAKSGSVRVPELYHIETYPRVHQMYSTIRATLRKKAPHMDVLLKAFPMGSMTGAPKMNAMRYLDELESSARGLYSGTIGFFTPNGTGDFNVVIRTLLYNEKRHVLNCWAGGGITDLSDAVSEYEECRVKAAPLLQLVSQHHPVSLP